MIKGESERQGNPGIRAQQTGQKKVKHTYNNDFFEFTFNDVSQTTNCATTFR